MIAGVTFLEAFIEDPGDLYAFLKDSVKWDERMAG